MLTNTEREMAETALRIVADIVRLGVLSDQEPVPRIRCGPATLRTAETLYAHAEQLAHRTGDRELLDLVARTPRPDAW